LYWGLIVIIGLIIVVYSSIFSNKNNDNPSKKVKNEIIKDSVKCSSRIKFGDVIIDGAFYGIYVIQNNRKLLFGSDSKQIYEGSFIKYMRGKKNVIIKRVNNNLSDFNKEKLLLSINKVKQKYQSMTYSEYKMLPASIFIQNILIDAGILSYYNGNAYSEWENAQGLSQTARINYQTLNKMPNYMQTIKFNCLSD